MLTASAEYAIKSARKHGNPFRACRQSYFKETKRNLHNTMGGHHLILGQLIDYISGETLDDTLDERHRQGLGRLLVEQKGFAKTDIASRHELEIHNENKCAQLLITYVVKMDGRIAMLVQYGPGSLVTRHRPSLAMARLVADYQVPVVVVSNGVDADILKGGDGSRLAAGLAHIPTHDQLKEISAQHTWDAIDRQRAEMEIRILMAYEVDGRCPCDDSTCKIESKDA